VTTSLQGEFDVIIRDGLVADGNGVPLQRLDVGIRGELIAEIGDLSQARAASEVDATGLVVAPGFVDVHAHSDITILVDPDAQSAVHQGVTTQVFPNCGMGLAPAVGEARRDIDERTGAYGVELNWTTVGEYYDRVAAARPAINVVPMVAQGTVRMAAMGYAIGPPTDAQLDEMKAHVRDAMLSGARGMCSGLRYVPGGYADVAEMAELATIVNEFGGVYATHMRSEGDNGKWLDAIDETLAVGRKSGVRVQISHLKALGSESWGRAPEALARIRDARENDSIDVSCDQYPYAATSSTLYVLFPQWSQEGGLDAFLDRAHEPDQRSRMSDAFDSILKMRGGPSRVVISQYSPEPELQGKTLAQIAEIKRLSQFDAAVEILRQSEGHVSIVYHVLEEADIEAIFREPFVMVASDGSAVAPTGVLAGDYYPHPRNYGCFPRVLGEYVRERHLVELPEAIRKMTSLPAERFRLENRGQIRPSWSADITVFDPETVADRATFEAPRAYPDGMIHVFVNGKHVLDGGQHTGARPGAVLFSESRKATRAH
jgi:N-acyl-D-amino-acid deacylase